jgi:outer membrane receptor protein involved in Fe transport
MTRSRRRKLQRLQTRQPTRPGAPLARPRLALRSAPLLSVLLTAMPSAHAADDTSGSGSLAEIVVTAQKREERLQDVPMSLQVVGPEAIEAYQVNSFDDYTKLLPSVSFQSYGPGQSQLFFRGIASGGEGGYGVRGGSLPASGMYIDEIPVTTIGNLVDFHAYDIARVEALSGPQGTLYGSSSLAGTMRIITNQPDPTQFSAGYDIQGNKFTQGAAGGILEGFVNIPITDNIAVRLVGFYEHDGGFIDNVPSTRTYTLGQNDPALYLTVNNAPYVKKDFNPVTTFGGRAAMKFDLNDRWTITPSVIYQHQEADGNFLWDPAEGYLKTNDYGPEFNIDAWYQAALTVKGKIGNWDVVYAGGYFNRDVSNEADYSYYSVAYDHTPGYTSLPNGHGGYLDPTQLYSGRDHMTKLTDEFRLSSPQDFFIRGLGGLFYQRQADRSQANFYIPGLASIPDTPAVPDLGDDMYAERDINTDRDYAVFGELSVDLVKNLTFTVGDREFWYDNNGFGFNGYAGSAAKATCVPASFDPPIPCADTDTKSVGNGNTHKFNLSWKIDPDRMVYGTVSTGFRPGGPNNRVGIAAYKPDTLTNYEIGWKTAWFDRSLLFNGAVFVEDWHGVQFGLPVVGTAGVISIYNAGSALSKGVESDLTWRIDRHLTFSTSGSYIHAYLTTNFCGFNASGNQDCSAGIAAPSGTDLPIQPHIKFNSTLRDDFNVGPYESFVQAAVFHQSSTRSWLTDVDAEALGNNPAFTTADFSAGFKTLNKISYEAFIQNAFGAEGELSRNTVCVPSICGFRPRIYGAKPRLIGIKISQRF